MNSNGDDVVVCDCVVVEVSVWVFVSELFVEDKFGAFRGIAAEVYRRRVGVSVWL